jgi:hypothetical protein
MATSWWSRLFPDDAGDRAQFGIVLGWLLGAGGLIGVAALAAAVARGWIGLPGFVVGLVLLPPVLYGIARVVWSAVGSSSRGVVAILTAAGNLAPDPTFSAEEALVMQGRPEDARDLLEARLAADPAALAVRFRLAALLRDDLGDFARTEQLYLDARAQPGAAAREDAIANGLIDLYHRTGNRGRLMAEFARYAERHKSRPEGAAAKRRLMELKADAAAADGRPEAD